MEKQKEKTKRRLVAFGEFRLKPEHQEKSVGPSKTVPDDSFTIVELLEKYARGTMPPVQKLGSYDEGASLDSEDLEKLRDSDLFDKEQESKRIAVKMLESEKKIKAMDRAAAEKRAAEDREFLEMREEIRARKKQRDSGQPQKPQDGPSTL